MTLRYKVFGIPGNFDEFVEAAKRDKQESVQLELRVNRNEASDSGYWWLFEETAHVVLSYPDGSRSTSVDSAFCLELWLTKKSSNRADYEKSVRDKTQKIREKLDEYGISLGSVIDPEHLLVA
jgi:hypothetical protein